MSPNDEKKPRKVSILVCSANLGNQAPDLESLAAWIPKDGNIKEVVDNQQYPLSEGTNPLEQNVPPFKLRHKTPTAEAEEPRPQFDILVIGMQEATFEVEGSGNIGGTITSQAIKAQKAVSDLTKRKDHIGKVKGRSWPASERLINLRLIPRSLTSSFISAKSDNKTEENEEKKTGKPPRLPKVPSSNVGSERTEIGSKRLINERLLPRVLTNSFTSAKSDNKKEDNEEKKTEEPSRLPKAASLNVGSERSEIGSNDDTSVVSIGRKPQLLSDTNVLHSILQTHLPSYKHAVSYQRGQMRQLIFYNDKEICLEVISTKAQNTGMGGLANKGGIVSEVLVDGTTRFAFFTAHLEAHEGTSKYETRCSSVVDIFKGTTSSVTQFRCDTSLASHFTFAMGDLNFRTRLPHHEPGSKEHIAATHDMVKKKQWDELYKHDELCIAIEKNHCFSGFSTPICSFPPTFKVHRQKGYVYNPKRSPSYTDRILYTTGHCLERNLKLLAYSPIDDFTSSDHKPLRGAFEVELNPPLKWRPTLSKRESRRLNRKSRMAKRIPNLAGPSSQATAKPRANDLREYLNLFISSLHVRINEESYSNLDVTGGRRPSPFVCFVSTPAEALKRETDKWRKLIHNVNPHAESNLSSSNRTQTWPTTRQKRNTFDAFWDDEETHFKVRTHTKEGLPIDLSGAMIHLVVFDGKSSGRLLGSFSLNLAHLIVQSRRHMAVEKTHVERRSKKTAPPRFGSGASHIMGSVLNLFASGTAHSVRFRKSQFHQPANLGSDSVDDDKKPEMMMHDTRGGKDAAREDHDDEGNYSLRFDDGFETNPIEVAKKRRRRVHRHRVKDNSEGEDGEHGDTAEATGALTVGPSAKLLRRRTTNKWGAIHRSSIESVMNARSMNLSSPLRKFGQQVGTIEFTIDAWWLSDADAADKKRRQGENPSD